MRVFAMFLMMLSLGLFSLGCASDEGTEPAETDVEAPAETEGEAEAAPAEEEGEAEAAPAEEEAAPEEGSGDAE